ncbi:MULTISPECIES: TetR/AcrR family transcriptional regulator [unclassified Burkholderia]|uniref:TetR/AcrR family transcriptional regulator n=2 Tax=Burkholderia TaxID=32008 RepID=UPI000F58AB5C|nr:MULTISPECIES: TetR/AcrR family transcriptional regulator [unclassified Burkholderia]RQR36885.1 TetR/AcrR family transcriptional regulator [Burkholderia sp. Bp9131]RQR75948.1 TetR/AcrR family transcriptional regulator [Burkholderia sp. Bp9011]RQR76333.1 TetR/AcrR family transcriptional regulator [Burkholderia sp. Bp9015]RQR86416.1 TetR/AcrR family transcriptional regulator [Burkholderia sp. Bp9010]RQR99663.1 TetR/AcrR family transcriptional regulator [Burkholderia sp. Bp8994]
MTAATADTMTATAKADRAEPSRAPAGRKSQQRVQDILRAGREVFAEKGYEHATAAEIAQRVGVSEATVFSYFRGKRELCARVIADWYDEIIAAFELGMPQDAPVQQQFAFIVRTHLRLMLVNGTGLCALVLSEGRAKQHALSDELTALQRRYTAPLMDVLARGQAAGQVRRDMPLSLLRSMVFGPIEHVLWDAILGHRKLDTETTATQLIDMLWAAVQPPAPEQAALVRFRNEVAEAVRRLEGEASRA